MAAAEEIIVICGPTSSGKTSLAVEIAKRINAQIVSADSMQIYKEMNIGTAKPSEHERQGIVHHMMDVVSVTEEYNVSRYVTEASACIDSIIKSGDRVILAGGTGLYIDSLINNVNFFEIRNDYEYRAELLSCADKEGSLYLHEMLREIDAESAKRLHPNDLKRVIRALEVYRVTGKTIGEIQRESVRERRYRPIIIGLDYQSRDALYERINRRVYLMIENGLLDEAKGLLKYDLSATARAAIGYREMFDCIDGKISLDEAAALICRKTRNYAKRQLTWFRKNSEINWLYPDLCENDIGVLADSACKIINSAEDKNEAEI